MGKNPNIKINASGFQKGMGSINSALKTTEKAWETFKKALKNGDPTSSIAALATSFTAVKTAAGVVVNAGKKVVESFKDLTSAGMKAADELDRMTTMLGSRSKANSLLGTIDQLEDISWESGEAISAFAQKLIGAGKDSKDVEQILTATVDICNTTGRSFSEVSTAIENAFAGKTKTIEKILPGLKDLGDQAWDSGDAIKYIGDELHDASIEIASGSFSNQLGAVANSWQRIKDNIGMTLVTEIQATGILDLVYGTLQQIEKNTQKRQEDRETVSILDVLYGEGGYTEAIAQFGLDQVGEALGKLLSGDLKGLVSQIGVPATYQSALLGAIEKGDLKEFENQINKALSHPGTTPAQKENINLLKKILDDIQNGQIGTMAKAVRESQQVEKDMAKREADEQKRRENLETELTEWLTGAGTAAATDTLLNAVMENLFIAEEEGFTELEGQYRSLLIKVGEELDKQAEELVAAEAEARKKGLEDWLKGSESAQVSQTLLENLTTKWAEAIDLGLTDVAEAFEKRIGEVEEALKAQPQPSWTVNGTKYDNYWDAFNASMELKNAKAKGIQLNWGETEEVALNWGVNEDPLTRHYRLQHTGTPNQETTGFWGQLGGTIKDTFTDSLKGAGEAVSMITKIIQGANPILLAVIEVVKAFMGRILPMIETVLTPIMDALHWIGESLADVFVPVFNAIAPAIEAIGSVLKSVLQPVIILISNALKVVSPLLVFLADALLRVCEAVELVFDVFEWIADAFKWVMDLIIYGIQSVHIGDWYPFGKPGSEPASQPRALTEYWNDTLDKYNNMSNTVGGNASNTISTQAAGGVTSASYQGGTTVHLNVYMQAPVVGENGMTEFAKMIRNEFESLDYYNA